MRTFKNIAVPAAGLLLFLSIIFVGRVSDAGVDHYIAKIRGWWQGSSISSASSSSSPRSISSSDEDADEIPEKEKSVGSQRNPGMCQIPRQPEVVTCEIGAGFLCVDSPPGGVDSEYFVMRGTIDMQGSVLAKLRIAVQHEYTKAISYVDTSSYDTSGCWDASRNSDRLCIDREGRYSVRVPLSSPGPHAVSISASRLSGDAVEKRIRTSRVVRPSLTDAQVIFSPDVKSSGTLDPGIVMVTLDLLPDCSFCDFIGASTGGLEVSVKNSTVGAGGEKREIACVTNVEQGGQGKFFVGVPVLPGDNELLIKVCNAATGDQCVLLKPYEFKVSGEVPKLEIISPPPHPSYDADQYPTISWDFRLGGGIECVDVQLNREEPRELCADPSGVFSAEIEPREGINIASMESKEGHQFSWTFGWGRIESPFSENGSMRVSKAAALSLSSGFLRNALVPFINNILGADEFTTLLASIFMGEPEADPSGDDGAKSTTSTEAVSIDGCEEKGAGPEYKIELAGIPQIGSIAISSFDLAEGEISIVLELENTRADLNVSTDADGDGLSDKDPLPLFVSFRKATVDLLVKRERKGDGDYLIFSSRHDDCSYKGKKYCKHIPSPLVLENIVGDASPFGHFIWCDVKRASSSVRETCKAFNSIHAQTAAVNDAILDAVNKLIYCGGSSYATGLMRGYLSMELPLGEEGGDGIFGGILPAIKLPLGFKLGGDSEITSKGLTAAIDLAVGNKKHFAGIPPGNMVESAGVILTSGDISSSYNRYSKGLGVSLLLDAVNALLYTGIAHGDGKSVKGLLDIDIHEPFFGKIGFDFVNECDAFEPVPGVKDSIPTLCYVRPRVMELLGSALSGYGYFTPKQPLLMAIRGNRALAPRLSVSSVEKMPVVPRSGDLNFSGDSEVPEGNLLEIQLGGVELSFYALEIDQSQPADRYGNLPIKLDSSGKPIIKSMRPKDPDPWKGQIVSFDVSALIGIEVGDFEMDESSESGYSIKIRTLSDRSRLLITPIEGTNATTIPSRRLISSLADQLMTALAAYSPKASAIAIPVPSNFSFEGQEDTVLGMTGLASIELGPDGIELAADDGSNRINILANIILEQMLHYSGEEKRFVLH